MMDTPRLRMESVPRLLASVVVAALLLALVPLARPAHAEPGTIDVISGDGLVPAVRYAGFNRYDTAQLIATDDTEFAADFSGDTVILATGERFPDALAGSTLGGLEDAPIVLTPRFLDGGDLDDDVVEALDDYDPATIYMLGGVEAISQEVEDAIDDDYDAAIVRIGGVDRYETAAFIADETEGTLGSETATAIVARGGTFPDALVSGAFAAALGLPLLLTTEDLPLDDDMVDRLDSLGIERVILAGGVEALSQDVEDAIEDLGIEVVRVFGVDRYETAVAFAEQAEGIFGLDGFGTVHANLARGDDFPDALALGPHAGLDYPGPSPIVLTRPDELNDDTAAYFSSIASADFEVLHVAGGVEAILPEVVEDARELLTAADDPASITLTPETATNFVGETHTVTATVLHNGGAGVDGASVEFTFDDGTETATVLTGETGTASADFSSDTPETITVTATVTAADGDELTATATKTYVDVDTTAYAFDPATSSLVTFDTDSGVLTGLGGLGGDFTAGTEPVGLDFRPATGELYVLASDGDLYTVATDSADATRVGATGIDFGVGSGVGVDFNPAANALRIVTDDGDNYRIPAAQLDEGDETITVTTDGGLNYDGIAALGVSGAAYENAVFQPETVTATELYDIDTTADQLVIQDPPNDGDLVVVGDLGVDATEVNGFDIYSVGEGSNVAYAVLTVGAVTSLYTIDLDTGEATDPVVLATGGPVTGFALDGSA